MENTNDLNQFIANLKTKAEQTEKQRQANQELYGVSVPDNVYNSFNSIIANAENKEQEAYKIGTAWRISENLGVDLSEAYTNLDFYQNEYFQNEIKNSKDLFEKISDNFKIGSNNVAIGNLGNKLKNAEKNGNEEEINAILAEIKAYTDDNNNRTSGIAKNWLEEALLCGAQTLPFTGAVVGAGIFGNLLGVGGVASYGLSSSIVAGQEYIDLRNKGVDKETASKVATISGGIQGALEVVLGDVTAFTGAVAKNVVGGKVKKEIIEKITNVLQKKLHYGPGAKIATKLALNYGQEVVEEGTEELLQELTSIISTDVAKELSKEQIIDEEQTETTAERLKDAFRGGVLGSLVLSGLPLTVNSVATIKEYKAIEVEAKTNSSAKDFENKVKDSAVFANFNDENQKKEIIKNVWEEYSDYRDKAEEEVTNTIKEVTETSENVEQIAEDAETEKEYRTENGKLYTENEINADGQGNFTIGDSTKSKNNIYGNIKYKIDEENKTITIDSFKMANARENLRKESFLEFAKSNAGYNIEWNTEFEKAKAIKESLIAENPNGKNNGLSYFKNEQDIADFDTRIKVANEIKKNIKMSQNEVSASVALLDVIAKQQGQTLTDYVTNTFNTSIFGDKAEFVQAQKDAGAVARGGMTWKQVGRNLKAVIYAGENANFSTWAHELAHVWQEQLQGEDKALAEKLFNVENGNWIKSQYQFADGHFESAAEAFARGFEDYLQQGKPKNLEEKKLFQKFAEFMARCYRTLQNFINFTPEIEEFYDKLLGDENSNSYLRQAEFANAQAERQSQYKQQETQETTQEKTNADEEIEQQEEEVKQIVEEILTEEQARETTQIEKDYQEPEITKAEKEQKFIEEVKEDYQDELIIWQLANEQSIKKMVKGEERERILKDLDKAKYFNKTLKYDDKTKKIKIKQMTNWELDNKGQWKYETDDSKTFLKMSKVISNTKAMLGEIYEAEELYTIFPFLRNVNVSFIDNTTARTKSELTSQGIVINLAYVKKSEEVKKELIHEIQHVIQAKEFTGLDRKLTNTINEMYSNLMAVLENREKHTIQELTETARALNEYMETDGEKEAIRVAERFYENEKAKRSNPFYDKEILKTYAELGKLSNQQKEYVANTLFQIIGVEGARRLDEAEETHIRMDNLQIAVDMTEAGKDAKTIRLATGWEKGVDGKWKYEIDDIIKFKVNETTSRGYRNLKKKIKELELEIYKEENKSEEQKLLDEKKKKSILAVFPEEKILLGKELIDNNKNKIIKLEEKLSQYKELDENVLENIFTDNIKQFYLSKIIDAPELFKAYPKLKGYEIDFELKKDEVNGFFKEEEHSIYIAPTDNVDKFKSTLLHEIQHAIQFIEGFAKGGNDNQFIKDNVRVLRHAINSVNEELKTLDEKINIKDFISKSLLEVNKGRKDIDTHFEDLQKYRLSSNLKNDYNYYYDELKRLETLLAEAENRPTEFERNLANYADWDEEELENLTKESYTQEMLGYGYSQQEIDNILKDGIIDYIEKKVKEGKFDVVLEEIKAAKEKVEHENDIKVGDKYYSTPFQAYKSLAGEVEARNVQTRMTLTSEERKQKLLAETMDIAEEQQIIMFQSLVNAAQKALDDVKKQYENTDKWLKAPNGNDTNLTEKQWLQVRTSQFKQWFGDWENDPENASKVVDENGEPLVVYHGTEKGTFDTFKGDNQKVYATPENTIWFTENRDIALSYSGEDRDPVYKNMYGDYIPAIYSTFLNIRNPYIYVNENEIYKPNSIVETVRDDKTYDGVILKVAFGDLGLYEEELDNPFIVRDDYVVFSPNQIKSATDNSGEFDVENPSILYQIAYHGTPHNFDNFSTSAMGTGEGAQSFGWGLYFTNQEDIARWYADSTVRKNENISFAEIMLEHIEDGISFEEEKAKALERYKNYENLEGYQKKVHKNKYLFVKNLNSIDDLKKAVNLKDKRNLYTVELPDNGYLLWDKIVDNDELEKIKKALKEKGVNDLSRIENLQGYQEQYKNNENATYTIGSNIYKVIADYLGSDKAASLFLKENGYIGIDYPANSFAGHTDEGKRNYVIFDEKDVEIINKIKFQTEEELREDALSFDTWQEFYEFYQAFGIPEVSPIPKDADAQWFQTTWELAHKITPEESLNEQEVKENLLADEQDNADAIDALWLTNMRQEGELEDFLTRINDILTFNYDDEFYSPEDEEELKSYEKQKDLQRFIRTQLKHGIWLSNAKRVSNGKELTPQTRQRMLTLIRNAVRDYRAIWAEIYDNQEFAVAEKDSVASKLQGKYKLSVKDDFIEKSPEERRQIAEELENKEIAKKIKDGTITMSSEVDKYLNSLNKEIKDLSKKYDELEIETKEDYQRLNDALTREILRENEKLLLARTKLKNKTDEIAKKTERGIKIASKYDKEAQNLRSSYDGIYRRLADLRKVYGYNAQIEEALKRQEKVHEIKEDLKKKKKEKNLLEAEKKLRIGLVKRTMRRIPFEKVNYEQAKTIIAIQRIFEPNLLGGINKWIGQEGAYLREVWSKWNTDSEYRERLTRDLNRKKTKSSSKLLELLQNTKTVEDFNNWTRKDRQLANRVLPKENWIKELNLEELAKEREESIQLDIKEKTETKVDEKGKTYIKTTVIPSEEITKLVRDAIGSDLYSLLANRPFAEWTIEEMETLAKRVDDIYTEGKALLESKKLAKKEISDSIRDKIEKAIKDTGIVINDDDSEEVKKVKKEKIAKILGNDLQLKGTIASRDSSFFARMKRLTNSYNDANILRVSRILDNYNNGINVNELYDKENTCYTEKMSFINSRQEEVARVMKENNITLEELLETVKIGDRTFTIDELLFFIKANEDVIADKIEDEDYSAPTARNAVIYGNFGSDETSAEFKEKCRLQDLKEEQKRLNDNYTEQERQEIAAGNYIFKPGTLNYVKYCEQRFNEVLNYAKQMGIDTKYKPLLDVISADYNKQYERMMQKCIEEFNQPLNRVNEYIPLVRLESNGDTNENRVREDFLATSGLGGKQWVDRGMTKKRISISPLNQKPVETGLYKTWIDSVERTEHFIAYSGYVRELNAVYKNRDAQYLRSFIENRYGKGALKYLDNYINEIANPHSDSVKNVGDELLRMLRGKTAPAYLAWKVSSILKQGLTSPLPFLQYVNPFEYINASWKVIATKGRIYDFIKDKSVFMRNRVMDPMNELVNELAEKKTNKASHALNKFNKIGMKGLEWIDWVCVANGWYAIYEREKARLTKENTLIYEKEKERLNAISDSVDFNSSEYLSQEEIEQRAINAQLDEGEIERKAVEYADNCVRESQPSNRKVDLAPLFKQNSEAWKAILQFQTSLNVIWQQIRYDLPFNIKQKNYEKVIKTIISYSVAGILMGLVCEGLPEDDEEENAKLKSFIYFSTTQFTDSIPLIGNTISSMNQQIMTGKGNWLSGKQDLTPMVNKFTQAAQNASKGNWEKAAAKTTEGIGLCLGLPVSGTKEILETLGIKDVKDYSLHLEALLGREPKEKE